MQISPSEPMPKCRSDTRRAKEWLMEQQGMDEGQAHRLLQQRSMICGRKLAETARLLLEREAGLALYG